ncbi:Hypothetical protein, putative [Bodo saltans]|uniref:Uncharacterized protein n=1 Tax=Bodo saltans TaxID=75058 RepID=A0A0S4IXM9_BODSA|nr:Hypothetical protein, putative [Bodo saltans]|eukprot:CUG44172.1 Hypothetical protein, putative [Bodo saltans]
MPRWTAASDDSSSETSSASSTGSSSPHPLTSSQYGGGARKRASPRATQQTTASRSEPSKAVQSFLSPSDDEADGPRTAHSSPHHQDRKYGASRDASPAPRSAGDANKEQSGSNDAAQQTKHIIHMDYNDEYQPLRYQQGGCASATQHHGNRASMSADQVLLVPNGSGTLQSTSGKHCYVGVFAQRERNGEGKLLTDKIVLWCNWNANRPEFTSSARLDTTSGDKYHGYLVARADADIVQKLAKVNPPVMSKFSIWVNATKFTKERWGELVSANGGRYFGQWVNDIRCGFGCVIAPNGDRYVGMFLNDVYHGLGVLFSRNTNSGASDRSLDGSPHRSGGSSRSLHAAYHASFTTSSNHREHHRPSNPVVDSILSPSSMTASLYPVVFDGAWNNGVLESSDALAMFPCGTKVRGAWRNTGSVEGGSVTCPRKPRMFEGGPNAEADFTKRWVETFQWESLLCGSSEGSKYRSHYGAKSIRSRLMKSRERSGAVQQLTRFLKEDTLVLNAMKVFRRCFYFFYGTCGSSSEIGGGLAGNSLGWCQFRGASGGCIHRGRGRVIQASDIDSALGDIFSLVASVHRWTVEILGEGCMDHARDLDADGVVTRHALDMILSEVHPVLLNLYVQVYKAQEENLQAAVSRLRGTTLDDLGVLFGRHESDKLFDPYADASRSLGDLSKCRNLTDMIRTLVMWSKEIDTSTKLAQVSLQDEQLSKISTVIRERRQSVFSGASKSPLPSSFSRSYGGDGLVEGPQSLRSLPDGDTSIPSVDVNAGGEGSSPPPSPTSMQWNNSFASPSSATGGGGDDSPSLGPQHPPTAIPAALRRRAQSKFIDAAVDNLEAGSADDLIPIHQYVLLRGAAGVPHMYAITKLLVDLSADDAVVDPTSRDSFCITTLHACVTTLMQLDPDLRERTLPSQTIVQQVLSVLTPASVFARRIDEAAQLLHLSSQPSLADSLALWFPATIEAFVDGRVVIDGNDGGSCVIEVTVRDVFKSDAELQEVIDMCASILATPQEAEGMLDAAKRLGAAVGVEVSVATSGDTAPCLTDVVLRLALPQGPAERGHLMKYLTPIAAALMTALT